MDNRGRDVGRSRHVLRPLALNGAVQGFVLRQQFPAEDLAAYAAAMAQLMQLFEPGLSTLTAEAFIQTAETGRAGSAAIRELGPMLEDYGLGIHPEAEPPRTWNREDFEKTTLNDRLPPLFLEIMRASSRRPGAIGAVRERFFGTGAYAEVHVSPGVEFYREATAQFKPRIVNRSARMFPYHAPIVRSRAAESVSSAELQDWMCGAQVYLREAVEEEGVMMLFRGSSVEVVERALRGNERVGGTVEFLV